MDGIALVNGQNHSHKQIVFPIGGVPITSMSDLSINEQTIREFSYGNQALPVGWGDGKDEPVEVSFSLSLKDSNTIKFASPNKKLTKLPPFDIPITYTNPSSPRFSIIKNILITGTEESSDSDTTDIRVNFTCIASHIKSEY